MESEDQIVVTKPKVVKKIKKDKSSKSDLTKSGSDIQLVDQSVEPAIAVQPVIAIEPASTSSNNDSDLIINNTIETYNLPSESAVTSSSNIETTIHPIEPTIITEPFNDYNDSDINCDPNIRLQKLEEKARKAEEAFAAEEKLRKELEELNSKLLAEKTALLDSLSGEKGALSEYQEKCNKLAAQKADLDNQLRVSIFISSSLEINIS